VELYKLLLYETGGKFLPHRDTEKSPGMFGTLVITLPSFENFEGGELVISHDKEIKTFDFSLLKEEKNKKTCHYSAFYSDCTFEIKPVTKGKLNLYSSLFLLIQFFDTFSRSSFSSSLLVTLPHSYSHSLLFSFFSFSFFSLALLFPQVIEYVLSTIFVKRLEALLFLPLQNLLRTKPRSLNNSLLT
jgi:hypothetical protein